MSTDQLIVSRSDVNDEFKMIDSDDKLYFVLDKRKCFCIQLSPPPFRIPEFYAVANLKIHKSISTSMMAPVALDTPYILSHLTSFLCFDKSKDQPLEVCVSTNGDCECQNRIVFIHIMHPDRSTLVLTSLSPRWLTSHNTTFTHVGLMGDVLGMNVLPQELIEEIVSHTSPFDAFEKLSIVSINFWSPAKFDNVWERFLAHQVVSDRWMCYDSRKKINSYTLRAFPTKKDSYLFLLKKLLIIDYGAMYFWLDKLSWNKCFRILSLPLSTMVPKTLSPSWLLSDNTIYTSEDLMGDISGMNALSQELIEEIVSRASPVDVCGKLSIVSRSFQSATKSEHVWERFLPADLISRRAMSNEYPYWICGDGDYHPWRKIDSNTLQAFPTKKDLYLFLSHNPLIIDDGDMLFWLDKPSGNICLLLLPDKLSKPEPNGWRGPYSYFELSLPFRIEGKIHTALLSPNTAYTAYLLFDFTTSYDFSGFGEEEPLQTCVGIDGGYKSESRIVYIPFMPCTQRGTKNLKFSGPKYPRRRNVSCYELELGDYFNKEGGSDRELKMCLSEVRSGDVKGGIELHGIEISPKDCKRKSLFLMS